MRPVDNNTPFRNQDIVREAVHNHAAPALLDNVGQDTVSRRHAGVTVREHVDIATFGPRDIRWSMDGELDIFTVEVQRRYLNLLERPPNEDVSRKRLTERTAARR
jgi:hypothetical protein